MQRMMTNLSLAETLPNLCRPYLPTASEDLVGQVWASPQLEWAWPALAPLQFLKRPRPHPRKLTHLWFETLILVSAQNLQPPTGMVPYRNSLASDYNGTHAFKEVFRNLNLWRVCNVGVVLKKLRNMPTVLFLITNSDFSAVRIRIGKRTYI